jgi:hypothetical protein
MVAPWVRCEVTGNHGAFFRLIENLDNCLRFSTTGADDGAHAKCSKLLLRVGTKMATIISFIRISIVAFVFLRSSAENPQ